MPVTDGAKGHDPLLRRVIDNRYRIDAAIGAGGMATVYRATRLQLGDVVAVKVLHAELLREPMFAERFRREAQAAARLKHHNVVSVYDFGVSEDGIIYLVMELVEGRDLRTAIKEDGPMPTALAVEIVRQICAALTEAHRQNIIHRDIKPANIAVDVSSEGVRVKVLDFGIASLRGSTMMTFTQTGTVLGTPAYMSPEQCLGEDLDGRSDIYSLGVVLFEMLAGVVPFNSPTATAVVMQHVQQAPPPLRVLNVSVSPAVEDVVLRALAKRREDRPQLARDLADELSAAAAGTAGPIAGGGGTNAATAHFSPSQAAQTMVQSAVLQPPPRPSVPPSRGQSGRTSGMIIGLAAAALIGALWIGVQWFNAGRTPSNLAATVSPSLAPQAVRAVSAVRVPREAVAGALAASNVVSQYYQAWDRGDFRAMYAMLSERRRGGTPFATFVRMHESVIHISVRTGETGDPLRVAVAIVSKDRAGAGTVDTEYRGTWTVIKESGTLKLDQVELQQIR